MRQTCQNPGGKLEPRCTLYTPSSPRHLCSSSKGCMHCTRTRSLARTHAAKRSIWVIKVMYYPPKWATQLEKGNKKPSIQQFPAKQNIFIISSSHDGKRDNFDFLPSTCQKGPKDAIKSHKLDLYLVFQKVDAQTNNFCSFMLEI